MADMLLFQGAMAGLKSAADIAIGMNKLKTMTEVNAKAIELQQIILNVQSTALSAQSQQAAMVQEIRELKEEVVRIKAWESQKQRYKLAKPFDGAVVYALKESMSAGEQPHWICTNCYEEGHRSILHPKYPSKGAGFLACAQCKTEVHYGYSGLMPEPQYASD